jgi:hypothetical protein
MRSQICWRKPLAEFACQSVEGASDMLTRCRDARIFA